MFKTSQSRTGFITAVLITTFCLLGILATPVAAHQTQNSEPAMSQQQVSASQARRITRSFLSKRGYSRNIGPGGSRINGVTSEGTHWLVNVTLLNSSAAGGTKRTLYINSVTGQISEQAPTQVLVVDSVNPAELNSQVSP